MPSNDFRASLKEVSDADHSAISAELAARRRADEDALDPIADPLTVPDDRPFASIEAIVARVQSQPRVDLVGAHGAALPLLVARTADKTKKTVVVLAADVERARTLVADLEFFVRREKKGETRQEEDAEEVTAEDAEDAAVGEVLMLAAPDFSPYAEVAPDRRAALGRLATLSHLERASRGDAAPVRALVVTAAGALRRVVPRATMEERTEIVKAEDELDRDELVKRLAEAGYLRVPVVEDPGSFAVRGALLDVWPPSTPTPVRIELYGDLVLSMKRFDPDAQRTREDDALDVLHLPPAREAILDAAAIERAKQLVADRCDAIDFPTARARQLAEDVAQGRAFFGAEGFLPAYHASLDPFWRYLPDDAIVLVDDPIAVASAMRDEMERARADAEAHADRPQFTVDSHYVEERDVAVRVAQSRLVVAHRVAIQGSPSDEVEDFGAFERGPDDAPTLGAHDQDDLSRAVKQARASKGKRGALDPLVRRLRVWRDAAMRTVITARATTQAERLVALLRAHEVKTKAHLHRFDAALLDDPNFGKDVVEVVVGSLCRGAVLPTERLVFVTEEEVFGSRVHRRAQRKDRGARDAAQPFLEDLRALSVGDLVVHVEHGIGKYLGLEHRDILGPAIVDADGRLHQPKTRVDLLVVEYSGGDRLYLPVYRLHQIQKYSGGEASSAKIDRLGGQTFAKSKQRVERAVQQMADELLRLYAERQALEGEPLPRFNPATSWRVGDDEYREFEATFPFEETPDQAKAIVDVLDDLEKSRPMDRLVCGDVGFGKTEVAIRAAYRAAAAGKQVAVLCPTTVLAQQHYLTFSQRLADHPIIIAPLSRFQDTKEQSETIRKLKEGKLDVVIGTHRILSKDVHFKNLGLLVVDEEQRFGVAHKERIKQLKTKVHVLTLTATPIPRTLQMAVSGLRDLSLITTPPVDRRAIRTLVTRYDEQVVREAITREISRGGQVFYVYNRVQAGDSGAGGIYEKARRVQELVPTARVAVAHGQMAEKALEQTMLDFVEGRFDVLCSTSIIESGLDIPRANTMIVDRADLFGLSQLYQLRGRVGRSKERAYCYLIIPPQSAMTDEARLRIEALEKHTDLGAGFKIASLDLEIRGAGDLLGAEQSGNVAQVGFEMFCQMLDEAVRRLRGGEHLEHDGHDVDPELSFDVEAFIPDDYVSDVGVRLTLYKRFAAALDEEQVNDLAAEMEDRFGPPPETAARFVRLMRLKTDLRDLRALGCEATRERVTLHLRNDTPLDPAKLMKVVAKKNGPWKLTPDMRLTRRAEIETDPVADGVEAAEKLVAELQAFRKGE